MQPEALGGDAGNGTNITVLIGPESAYILKFGSMHPLEGSMKRVGENKSFHIAPQPATNKAAIRRESATGFSLLSGGTSPHGRLLRSVYAFVSPVALRGPGVPKETGYSS